MNETHLSRRDLWLTRGYYLISLGGSGFISPFLNLFFVQQGLSGLQVGFVGAVGSVVGLVMAPLWTNRSERAHNPRLVLQIGLLLAALGYLWLGYQTAFEWIVLVTALRALVVAGVSPMSDALVLSVTGATKSGFGSVRVYASIGWAVTVLVSGWLIERYGIHIAFWGVCIVTALGVLIIAPIDRQYFVHRQQSSEAAPNLKMVVRSVLSDRSMLALGGMMAVIGLSNSGVGQFETVYLDLLGASASVIGVAGMVSAVVEIPCMLWADRLVRVHGPRRLLLVSMLMTGVLRLLVLAYPAVATIIAERAIGGISFSFYSVALIRFLNDYSRPGQTRTVLALYNVTLAGVIALLGNPLSGQFFDLFGARGLYAVAALGYGLGWLSIRMAKKEAREVEEEK